MSALPAGFAEGKRLWALLAGSGLVVAAALGVRVYLHQRTLRAATEQAEAALARNTFGGFREVDQVLAPLVPPGSSQGQLLALRAYALAEIAARYDDDQAAAVESDLLLMPLELSGALPGRASMRRGLPFLLLAGGEPGSALTALGRAPEGSREDLSVLKARIASALDRPDLAEAAIAESLSGEDPPGRSALQYRGQSRVADPAVPEGARPLPAGLDP